MSGLPALHPPSHSGSRLQAQELVRDLAADLSRDRVVLDLKDIVVSAPSFLDEVVKGVLIERRAAQLDVLGASPRAAQLLQRAARNREAEDRLRIE